MYDLPEWLQRRLELVDLVDVERELLPREKNELVIGVLDEEQRRWHALQAIEFRRRCRINREMLRLVGQPLSHRQMRHWILESRDCRIRLRALEGLFLLALNQQFPGAFDCDVIIIREGWTFVTKPREAVTERDIRIGNVIADDLANNDHFVAH